MGNQNPLTPRAEVWLPRGARPRHTSPRRPLRPPRQSTPIPASESSRHPGNPGSLRGRRRRHPYRVVHCACYDDFFHTEAQRSQRVSPFEATTSVTSVPPCELLLLPVQGLQDGMQETADKAARVFFQTGKPEVLGLLGRTFLLGRPVGCAENPIPDAE